MIIRQHAILIHSAYKNQNSVALKNISIFDVIPEGLCKSLEQLTKAPSAGLSDELQSRLHIHQA